MSKRQEITSVGENVQKSKPSYTVDGNANWCSHYGKQYGDSFQKLRLELPFDPAIPLLDIDTKNTKTLIQKDIYTLMFFTYNSQDMETP